PTPRRAIVCPLAERLSLFPNDRLDAILRDRRMRVPRHEHVLCARVSFVWSQRVDRYRATGGRWVVRARVLLQRADAVDDRLRERWTGDTRGQRGRDGRVVRRLAGVRARYGNSLRALLAA